MEKEGMYKSEIKIRFQTFDHTWLAVGKVLNRCQIVLWLLNPHSHCNSQANVTQRLHDHCGAEERTNPADLLYIDSTGCQSKTSVILQGFVGRSCTGKTHCMYIYKLLGKACLSDRLHSAEKHPSVLWPAAELRCLALRNDLRMRSRLTVIVTQ